MKNASSLEDGAEALSRFDIEMRTGLSLLCKGRWVAARQLGGILILILYDFVKIPQSFFAHKKRQLPLQGSLCRTAARAVPTVILFNQCASIAYHQFRRNCISSKRSFAYHQADKIHTCGDEIHAKA